jgi:16S rRNA processing protein RimM
MLEVGRVLRAHGLKGDVVVDFVSDRPERRAPGAVLRSSAGDLTVERAEPFQDHWRVRFAGVADRTAAERLRGVVLRAEPIDDDDGRLWVHELVGAEVVGIDGRRHGRVEAVEANPAADLLVLGDGALVPVAFVVSHSPGVVVIDPPLGLLDDADADVESSDPAADPADPA